MCLALFASGHVFHVFCPLPSLHYCPLVSPDAPPPPPPLSPTSRKSFLTPPCGTCSAPHGRRGTTPSGRPPQTEPDKEENRAKMWLDLKKHCTLHACLRGRGCRRGIGIILTSFSFDSGCESSKNQPRCAVCHRSFWEVLSFQKKMQKVF